MTEIIYKICSQSEWDKAAEREVYTGSSDDERDGFIHLSTWEQVPGTLEKHFKGQQDLLLIAVDEAKIKEHLKYEASRDGDLFPHLYGQLQLDAVIWVKPVDRALEGEKP
ncbi:MAG: DUF952 domain-containing protein [Methyloligellaceae bacterium]